MKLLGKTVRDRMSGFSGIASSYTESLTGNVQYSIQAPAKDGVLADPVGFDVQQVDLVEGPTLTVTSPPADVGIKLGEAVEDIVSGFKGTVTRKVTFVNGCVYFIIMGKFDPKTGHTVEDFTEWKRLKRTGVGVSKTIATKAEKAVVGKGPGGPNVRMQRV
jgi:hypothetical protein